jgi:tetratricopeptide (TPR) repeat protein
VLFRSSILLDAGKTDEALAELDRAPAAGPEPLAALKLRAEIALHQKKYDDAGAALQKALALAPQDEELRARLGHVLLEKRDYQGALRELSIALHAKPQDMDALRDWMAAQYLSGNYEAALAALDQLAHGEQSTDRTWYIRATCYDKLGRRAEALEAYQKFLSLHASTDDNDYFVATARVRTLARELKEKKK